MTRKIAGQDQSLDRRFRGLPVRDADGSIIILATEEIARRAVPRDPENCVLALGAKEQWHSPVAEVWDSTAYVAIPNEKGELEVLRFHLDRQTRDQIEHFDRTGEFPPGGFRLVPCSPSKRLDAQLTRQRARASGKTSAKASAAAPKPAAIVGEVTGDAPRPAPRKGLRSGSGQVHFTRKAKGGT